MNIFDQYLESLAKLISFKSVKGEPDGDAPFGLETKRALEYFLEVGKSMGFETINHENYAGEVLFGEGEDFGIIGHLDVVPEGIGWDTDPYTLTIKDDVAYGRGVDDNKGPTLACLFALKQLKDEGFVPKKRLHLIAGCNEETGWEDVKYLEAKGGVLPEQGFSPDGCFPATYAEKGILNAHFYLPKLKNYSGIKGGTVINAVCALVTANATEQGINESLLHKHGLMLKDGNVIESVGKSAHGSTPHLGKNAILPLLEYFTECGEDLSNVIDCLFKDKHGLSSIANEQGMLTFSPNLICEKDGEVVISCDCRFPAPYKLEEVLAIIDKFGIKYDYKYNKPPFMVEKDGFVITSLLKAYRDVTGDMTPPKSLGGSTFARAFKSGCSFGPTLPGSNHHVHEPNEQFKISELKTMFEIYYKAIKNICE